MATTTKNLGLTQPGYTDVTDVTVFNTNFAIIDNYIGQLAATVATLQEAIKKLQGTQAETASDGKEVTS